MSDLTSDMAAPNLSVKRQQAIKNINYKKGGKWEFVVLIYNTCRHNFSNKSVEAVRSFDSIFIFIFI